MVLKVKLNEKLEKRFRELAMIKYGFTKGALLKASEAAIIRWVNETESKKSIRKVKNPVALIEGLLKEYKGKTTSVELQHEASRILAKKAEE